MITSFANHTCDVSLSSQVTNTDVTQEWTLVTGHLSFEATLIRHTDKQTERGRGRGRRGVCGHVYEFIEQLYLIMD